MPKRDDEYMALQRNRILDAALKEFATHGFRGASVRKITQAARLSPGTLYIHFKSKDALIRGLIKRRQDRFPELASGTVDDLLRAMRRSWSEPLDTNTRRLNALFVQMGAEAMADARVARMLRKQGEEWLGYWVAAVERDPRFARMTPDRQRDLGRRLYYWWHSVASERIDNPEVDGNALYADAKWGFEAIIAKTLSEG